MMKILLVDVDSKVPNIALCKLSSYHKSCGDDVELIKLKYKGYPSRTKETIVDAKGYEKVYVSTIFTHNKDSAKVINCPDVAQGGSGYDLNTNLPDYIEVYPLDYSIYKDNDISYGFMTRGCVRNCEYCFVPKKEGALKFDKTVDEIYNPSHKMICFLDNNILAYKDHKKILKDLGDRRIRCQFAQGLDIRLLDEENLLLLQKLNYVGEYTFAFDFMSIEKIISEKLDMIKRFGFKKRLRFYVFVSPRYTSIADDVYRIDWLRSRGILPYVMRENTCWGSEHEKFYTDLAAWCNTPLAFKKISFKDFLFNPKYPKLARSQDKDRLYNSLNLYLQGKKIETKWPGDMAFINS